MKKRSGKEAVGRGLLLAALLFLAAAVPVSADEAPKETELYARSAVLMDGESGRILYDKNGQEKLPMASTTKIMTCIVALEEGDLTARCAVSSYAASMPAVHMNVREGEEYQMEDLLYAMMLESYNDAAVVVAEAVAGSVEDFALLMNQKAEDLKCENTHFVTPNGLDGADEGGVHSTTAADLARIMSYCIRNPQFCQITGTQSYTFTDCSGSRSFTCSNHNAFLHQMEGAFSGKTGFTGNAGYCYVGALREEDRTFVVALLACGWPNNRSYKWSDTKKLMTYGLENYHYREYSSLDLILEQMPVSGGKEAYVGLALEAVKKRLLLREDENAVWEIEESGRIPAPVMAGATVGYAMLKLGDEITALAPITTAGSVEEEGWSIRRILPWKKTPEGT